MGWGVAERVCVAGLLLVWLSIAGVAAAQEDAPGSSGSTPDPADEVSESPAAKEKRLLAILEASPQNSDYAYELGGLYYDQGKREKAIEYYRRAIANKPGFFEATVDLGIVLNESGQSEEALAEFDKALKARPEDPRALCSRGQALYALRRYSEALEHYQRAAEIDPRSQLAHYLIGIAFADAGIYREAIIEWQKVVQIAPHTEQAATAKQGIEVLEGLLPTSQP